MSFAGKLARGVATGLSGYYGKLADQQSEDRRAQILLEREKALSQFQSGLRREESALAADQTRKTYADKVATDVAGEVALLPRKAAAEASVNEAKERARLTSELTQMGVKFKYDTSLAELREKAEMERTRLRESGEDRRTERRLAENVVATGVDGAGNIVVLKGNDTPVTFRGAVPTPRAGGDDEFGGIAPRAPRAPVAAPAATADSSPNLTYTQSDLEFTAKKYGKTVDEVQQELNASGYRLVR